MAVLAPMPERQRQHRRGREARRLSHQPQRVTEIVRQLVEPAQSARLPAVVLDGIDGAEFHAGAPHRFGGRQAFARQIVGAGLDVEADFVAHLAFETIATKQHARRASEDGTTWLTPRLEWR
jgi:hypothetical protein